MARPKASPRVQRAHGWVSLGERIYDLVSFYGRPGVRQASSTASTRSVLENLGMVAAGGIDNPAVAVTATTAGDTTGVIADSSRIVVVTSSASTKKVTLPTPVQGRKVTVIVGANGCKLQSTAPASVAINGGSGAGVVSAISANVTLELTCTSTTTWTGFQVSSVGAVTAIAVAA